MTIRNHQRRQDCISHQRLWLTRSSSRVNPGLTNYPNFVAGQAVKAVVSPDGNTLAILTAGMTG